MQLVLSLPKLNIRQQQITREYELTILDLMVAGVALEFAISQCIHFGSLWISKRDLDDTYKTLETYNGSGSSSWKKQTSLCCKKKHDNDGIVVISPVFSATNPSPHSRAKK